MTDPAFAIRARWCAALVIGAALATPPLASAQTPVPGAATIDLLTAAPAVGEHAVSLTVGAQVKDGRTETLGVSVDGWYAYTTHRRQSVRFDIDLSRADFRPAAGAPRIVVEDNHQAALTFMHPLNNRVELLARGFWRRDKPLALSYRVLGMGGVAFNAVRTRSAQLVIAPVVAAGRQKSALPGARDGIVDLGVLQTLHWRVTPTFALQNSFDFFRDVDNSADRSAAFEISGTAMIAKHVGVKVSYSHTHDTIRPPSTSATQQEVDAGVTITFRGK
ncbi:MAG: DUF481 domain-containing protein [Acidobacteriota bacterium]|nr:DUF481 domain-containing protein [Acidobacteriota bacterium]